MVIVVKIARSGKMQDIFWLNICFWIRGKLWEQERNKVWPWSFCTWAIEWVVLHLLTKKWGWDHLKYRRDTMLENRIGKHSEIIAEIPVFIHPIFPLYMPSAI